MIFLDPELDPDPLPHRPRTVRGRAAPALDVHSVTRVSATRGPRLARHDRMPSSRRLARFLNEAQTAVRLRGTVTVLLTTDAAMRRLNRRFRGLNNATDVLSFPAASPVAGDVAGDLAISVPTALRQAIEQGHALSIEIKVLMLHGLLHLAGYDHESDAGRMARRERQLRARLGLPQGLIERTESKAALKSFARRDGRALPARGARR
jgi:probable rRNA maturation factor